MSKGKETLTAWISVEAKEKIKDLSRVTGLTMSEIVRVLIEAVNVEDLPEKQNMAELLAKSMGRAA